MVFSCTKTGSSGSQSTGSARETKVCKVFPDARVRGNHRPQQLNPARRGAGLQCGFLLGELLKIANGFFFAPNADHAGNIRLPLSVPRAIFRPLHLGCKRSHNFLERRLFDHAGVVAEKPRPRRRRHASILPCLSSRHRKIRFG